MNVLLTIDTLWLWFIVNHLWCIIHTSLRTLISLGYLSRSSRFCGPDRQSHAIPLMCSGMPCRTNWRISLDFFRLLSSQSRSNTPQSSLLQTIDQIMLILKCFISNHNHIDAHTHTHSLIHKHRQVRQTIHTCTWHVYRHTHSLTHIVTDRQTDRQTKYTL